LQRRRAACGGYAPAHAAGNAGKHRRLAGSAWHRCLTAAKSSATILWARFTIVVTALATCLIQLADFVNAPSVTAAITTYLKPCVVAAIMVTVAVVTEWARRRTLHFGSPPAQSGM
jgi:hypothetical protein